MNGLLSRFFSAAATLFPVTATLRSLYLLTKSKSACWASMASCSLSAYIGTVIV